MRTEVRKTTGWNTVERNATRREKQLNATERRTTPLGVIIYSALPLSLTLSSSSLRLLLSLDILLIHLP